MENPATWGPAEHVVMEAYEQWLENHENMVCGLSLMRTITDALRREGLLVE
jgi:hypothetical protein